MGRMRLAVMGFSAAAVFIALTSAREAAADDPAPADAPDPAATPATAPASEPLQVEIAARAGVGLFTAGAPPAFGLGLRAGLSFGSIYLGATLTNYFAGGTYTTGSYGPGALSAPQQVQTEQRLLYGVGLGYDFKPRAWLTIRPDIGVGAASVSGTCPSFPSHSCTATDPYIESEVTALFALGTHLFVGADAGVTWVPGAMYAPPSPGDGFLLLALNAQVGARF